MSGYDSSSVEHQDTNNLTRQKRILSFAFSKKIPPLPQDDERPFYPNYFKQFHKFLFFTWMLPLIQVGYLRTLQPEDMPKLNNELKVEQLHCKFDKIFSKHLQKLKHNHLAKKYEERNETPESSTKTEEEDFEDFKVPAFVLVKSLYFTFFLEFNTALLFKIFSDVLTCLLPLIQKALINFVSKRYYNMEVNMGQGVGYAVGVCLMILMNGICINHSFYQSMMVGSMSKAILTKSLLLKSFTISAKGKHKFPMGTVNTLMGADLSRVDFAAGLLSFGITFPIPFTITIVLLIINIGPIALVGLGLFFFSSMFVGVAAAGMLDARQNATIWTDKRVNLIKELLKNFKVVKLYSWENAYSENVAQFREKEMKYVSKLQLIRNSIVAYAVSLPNTVSMITFLCLYGLDTSRSAADIFSSLTLFNVISNLFLMVPMSAATAADAVISLRRVGEFIACPDVVPYDDSQIPNYSLIKSKFEESGDAVQKRKN
ncbi:unnamed protein product [[Candida] boidinii]|uniref:Unnamed protein product n=1 Tax=Candida boidinii TaxID=5477 RepID=A0ACB5TTE0_CANBO|nr:unnamed protein product [[Candida] boidinii]